MAVSSIFSDMTDGDNSVFCSGVATEIANIIMTATVTTTDVGTVSAGAFVGVGTGTISVQSSDLESALTDACDEMDGLDKDGGGNDTLAEAFATGLDDMMSNATITINVTGTATAGSTATALSGTSDGTFTGVSATVQSGLQSCFSAMDSMTSGGDDLFATTLETLVKAYIVAGVIQGQGQGALSGSIGTGVAVVA